MTRAGRFNPDALSGLMQQPAHKRPAWLSSSAGAAEAVAMHKGDDPKASRAYLTKEWTPADLNKAKRLGMDLQLHFDGDGKQVESLDQVRVSTSCLAASYNERI